MIRCASCGAALADASTWCGQCFAPVRDEILDPVEGLVEVQPVLHPRSMEGVAHEVPQYSRWRKSETSFGPFGRVLWTLFVVLVSVFTVLSANPFAMIAWSLFVAPLVLRSVWARQRVT